MPVRPLGVLALAVALLAACGSSPPAASPSPPLSPPSPSAAAGATGTPRASAAPTASPASASATPVATSPIVNADGSVWIPAPAPWGFTQPGDDAVWGVLQDDRRHIIRIDPETYEITTLVPDLPILPNPVSLVAASGSIWLSSYDKNSVTQYDAETGEMIREIDVGLRPIEPVVAYGDVWTINHNGDSVTRIDDETGEAYPPIDLPGSDPLTITVVADDLMLVNGPEGNPTTWMVDPIRMELIGTYRATECFQAFGYLGVAIDGLLWRKRCGVDEVTIADPRTGEILESFEAPIAPYPPLYVDDTLWFPLAEDIAPRRVGFAAVDPDTHDVVGTYEQSADTQGGWWFAEFDSWWRWGDGGLLRVPADTLRQALR